MAKRTVVAAPGKKVALDLVAPSFPVVVVGASAGGLAAFTAFLKALPTDCGLAYVFIQHLIPNRESALTLLLSRATAMLVTEAEDNELVQPDHVYVIPPNRNITIHKGRLILTKRTGSPGLQRPIDNFAIALAADAGSSAIGVILSGTGSDGTDGLRAIKAAGGVTFAQDPKTAEWPDMPASAITAGVADFTLSTKQIAVALAKVGRQSNLGETTMVPEGSDLGKLCLILEAATGIDFRLYKQATVRRRISRRMALQKIATLSKYILILKQNPGEAQALADSIFIHVTSFFRDPECFQALSKRVMAKLAQQTPEDTIRIWVSACSTERKFTPWPCC